MDLETQHQLQNAAQQSRQERERHLDAVEYPSRKTGEMNALKRIATEASKTLAIYDVQQEPPAYADLVRSLFDETIARLYELCAPAPSNPAA